MAKKPRTTRGVIDLVTAASEGDFSSLVGGESQRWWDFVVERVELGADELMIRLDLNDPDVGTWYLWLVFSVRDDGRALTFEEVLVPDYEDRPSSALEVPQGREQVPYFVLAS